MITSNQSACFLYKTLVEVQPQGECFTKHINDVLVRWFCLWCCPVKEILDNLNVEVNKLIFEVCSFTATWYINHVSLATLVLINYDKAQSNCNQDRRQPNVMVACLCVGEA
jgi:hypothetical protein